MAKNVRKRTERYDNSKKTDNPKKDDSPSRLVPVTLTVAENVLSAAQRYRKDFGLSSDQDVLRLGVARFLRQEGYLINV